MHGFLLSDGVFSTIDYPGSTMTHAYGINARGDIVGEYRDSANVWHGFVLACGDFTPINFPGAATTSAWGMNYKFHITGTYKDTAGRTNAFEVDQNGLFTAMGPPFRSVQVQTHGINNAGDVVGCWWDAAGKMHSLLITDGKYITNDFPGSVMSMNWRINISGWMVGHYVDAGNSTHGYLTQRASSVFTPIDFPGATLTEAHGINNSMQIVGRYKDTANVIHGFLYSNN